MVDDLENIIFAKPGLILDIQVQKEIKECKKDLAIMFDSYAITIMPDQSLEYKELDLTMHVEESPDGVRMQPVAQGVFGTNLIVTVQMPINQRENVSLYVENEDGTVIKIPSETVVDKW